MNINESTRHVILSNIAKYSVDEVERIQAIYGERSS